METAKKNEFKLLNTTASKIYFVCVDVLENKIFFNIAYKLNYIIKYINILLLQNLQTNGDNRRFVLLK